MYRNPRASVRLCDVGGRGCLETGPRMCAGKFGSMFLRDTTAKRTAVAFSTDFLEFLHLQISVLRRDVREKFLQMGRVRRRRPISFSYG